MSSSSNDIRPRRQLSRDAARILGDCRDLVVERSTASLNKALDRAADVLLERSGSSQSTDESVRYLAARRTLTDQRRELMDAFGRRAAEFIDQRAEADAPDEEDFFRLDATKLALVDALALDESVLTGNIRRSFENLCHEQLVAVNHGVGQLLGHPDLQTDANPLAPEVIVVAFAEALREEVPDEAIKLAILRALNHCPPKDIGAIYTDVTRHLVERHVMPANWRPASAARDTPPRPRSAKAEPTAEPPADARGGELDLMSLFQELRSAGPAAPSGPGGAGAAAGAGASGGGAGAGAAGAGAGAGGAGVGAAGAGTGAESPAIPAWLRDFAPPAAGPALPSLPPTPSGYVPGAPVMASTALGEGLARLQAGEQAFAVADGTQVAFPGIPDTSRNVLRDLQDSDLGKKVNQLEAMTIELVAMAFDFVFDTRDLPDGIKAVLARLQIPVLKAAMLDGAFFAKKTHPARLLVNALAEAGRGWSTALGHEDPLYRKISEIVHRILDGFSDDLAIFEEQRAELERFLAAEAPAVDANLQQSTDEVEAGDRRAMAPAVVRAALERRLDACPVPNFVAAFVRNHWAVRLEDLYVAGGDAGDAWDQSLATVDDLVWSVQPKRSREDRKRLVALLPSLLKRLTARVPGREWPEVERQRFMENLVEAHAAAVRPGVTAEELPTEIVAEQAKAAADEARAAGDAVAATKAAERAEAMARAAPVPPPVESEPPPVARDEFFDLARDLQRGTWVEFEGEDGEIAFARLAWVSPLRGTYLFTNRLGRKALSMTAAEVAELFRTDRARCVEAEPLLDQAFTSVLANFAPLPGVRRRSA